MKMNTDKDYKVYLTEFKAKCNITGDLKTYAGEDVVSQSMEQAQFWCYLNKPHLKVVGCKIKEIDYHNNPKKEN